MARQKVDKEVRRKINDARRMIEKVMKADGNEAETRRRVERIFESVMDYDAFEHLSRERAVKGAGETEHVDFAIQIESGPDAEPVIMVELKRAGVDLSLKHLKQVTSYAIDSGCEWVLLTNGREWKLYHVEFGQPPLTKLVDQWNLLVDDVAELAIKFDLLNVKNIKRGSLDKLWEKATVLSPQSLLSAIASSESISTLRRVLKKNTGVIIDPSDLLKGISKILNENAAIELSKIKVDIETKRKKRNITKKKSLDSNGHGNVRLSVQEDASLSSGLRLADTHNDSLEN